MDLRIGAEDCGLRRLWALVQGLPTTAAVWREQTRWTQQHELTVALIHIVDMWGRINAQLQGAKPSKLPKPPQIERPGEEKPMRKKANDANELAAFFNRLERR
jgi:hypothetical protein